MKTKDSWPKSFVEWRERDTLFLSVPFTWDLPAVANRIIQGTFDQPKRIRVGGPAVTLMPKYLAGTGAEIGGDLPGVLQRYNPLATRTTVGCPRRCPFCAVPRTEGEFRELEDWPDHPILIDNNFLKASIRHVDRVFDRLEKHGRCDFNQGLDARLLTEYHAERLKRIGSPVCRLALDWASGKDSWERAFAFLKVAGIQNRLIRSYALIGYDTGVDEAWERCRWIEGHGVKPLPMWFHELNALEKNALTRKQFDLGWNDRERRRIMQWFYQHKQAKV
jgi:hypothetical protein